MTEKEWLDCRNAREMVDHLTRRRKNRPDDRKFRLIMCGACRLVWDHFPDSLSHRVIETAEQVADDLTTAEILSEVEKVLSRSQVIGLARAAVVWLAWGPWCGYGSIGIAVSTVAEFIARLEPKRADALRSLVRCLVGNPFRPVAFNPAWRTTDVLLLAQGIYDERAFDRMPILADALQDAGCDSADILAHCRDPHATHVRGCWVVDLVLGKS
jgi:hypothetical protein